MPEIFRTRDVVVLFKGKTITLPLTQAMIDGGWPGMQGVQWVDSPTDQLLVGFSDGERGAGFVLWGSNEDSDVFTSMTENQPAYGHAVVCSGGWIVLTRIFETLTLASGRTVPIVYTEGEPLMWSLRGYLTTEDEWTVSGDPRGANENVLGWIIQPPSALTEGYMTVHLAL